MRKLWRSLPWLSRWAVQQVTRRGARVPVHLVVALTDHFEPSFQPEDPSSLAPLDVQESRLERWCEQVPKSLGAWRDAEGRSLQRTHFFPAEQYVPSLIERLAEHCSQGWGEIEIHLHHGWTHPDTSENTRRVLTQFRDRLVAHGCLSRLDGTGAARYGFIHGNWTLANSGNGHACGVDDELEILGETGCYADFTLPSAPDPAQIAKINAVYECAGPLGRRAAHRHGRDLAVGRPPQVWPLMVQGPLGIDFGRRARGIPLPRIENSGITTRHPPTMHRLKLWRAADITVRGRPEWVFVKLHCHGMDSRDEAAMTGPLMQHFLGDLTAAAASGAFTLHFVSARETVNLLLAACDGKSGNPTEFRDYRLKRVSK